MMGELSMSSVREKKQQGMNTTRGVGWILKRGVI